VSGVAHLLVMLMTPLAPLALGLTVLLAPSSRALQAAAVLAPLPALATSVAMPSGIGATLPWLLEGSEFGLDPIGRTFLLAASAIWLAAALFAVGAPPEHARGRFFAFFLFAMAGNLGLIVAQDMLAFYLFFSLMSFSAYGLVVHDGSRAARRAGSVYIALVVAGDMMLYAALVPAALDAGGAVMFDEVRASIARSPHRDLVVALTLAGFGVKAGVLGLHVALPLIYRAAPTPAAGALAGAMVHAGLLGWLRLLPLGNEADAWGVVLVGVGLGGTFYGAVVGTLQRDARSVLAYSSISQMGIMLAGIGAALASPRAAGTIAAALALYALHHAFAKGSLLLGVGVAAGPRTGRIGRGAARAGLLLPALALPGVPLTSGMPAKESLKEAVVAADSVAATLLAELLPWTAVATTLVVARFLQIAWPLSGDQRSTSPVAAFAWGLTLVGVAAATWAQPLATALDLWHLDVLVELMWPVLLGAAIAFAAARYARRVRHVPWVPPGDLALPVGRFARGALDAWTDFAYGPLPDARNRVRDTSTVALRDRRWGAAAQSIEGWLRPWGTAVILLVVVTLVLIWLSPAGR